MSSPLKLLSLFIVFFTLSCDLGLFDRGLGPKVDIEPPKVAVLTPAMGSYQRGQITLTGTATDDSGSVTVHISFMNGSEAYVQQAVVNGETWSAVLDTTLFPEDKEGTTITVIARDGSDKEAQDSRLLYFDNTSPTVKVDSPGGFVDAGSAVSVLEGNNKVIITNGEIKVEGAVFDAGKLDRVEVEFIPLSGNEAIKGEALGEGANWFFQRQTDIDDNGYYHLMVTAWDLAGNSNTFYYHSDDVRKESIALGKNIKIDDLAFNENGSFDHIQRTTEAASRVNVFISQDSDLPVVDLSASWDRENLNTFEANVPVNARISDDDAIKNITLTVYKKDEYGSYIPVKEGYVENVLDKVYNLDLDLGEATWRSGFVQKPGFPYSDLPLDQGNFFLKFTVDDISVPVKQITFPPDVSDYISFEIDHSSPVITIDEPPHNSVFNNSFVLKGEVREDNRIGEVKIIITGSDITDITLPATYTEISPGLYSWEASVSDFTPFQNGSAYSVKVQAVDGAGKISSENIQFSVDKELPAVALFSPVPKADINDQQKLNGTVQLLSYPEDNNQVVSVTAEVKDAAGTIGSIPFNYSSGGWIADLDTSVYQDEGVLEILLAATDRAGNRGVSPVYSFMISQESDKPVIEYKTGKNFSTAGITISGSFKDDDLIDPSSATVSINGAAPINLFSVLPAPAGFMDWQINLTDEIAGNQGQFILSFSVSDLKNGDTTDQGASVSVVKDVEIVVDNGKPVVFIETIEGLVGSRYINGPVTLKGTASDGISVDSLDIRVMQGESQVLFADNIPLTPVTGAVGKVSWEYVLNLDSDNSYEVYVEATDAANSVGDNSVNLIRDTLKPSLSLDSHRDNEAVNGEITLEISALDDNNISSMRIKLGDDPYTSVFDSGTTGPKWYKTVNTRSISNGLFPVIMEATDNAGNVQTIIRDLVINQDTDKPVINLTNIDKSKLGKDNLIEKAAQIQGNVTDDDGINAGAVEVRVRNSDGTLNADYSTWASVGNNDAGPGVLREWRYSIDKLDDGFYTLEVQAVDNSVNLINSGIVAVPFCLDKANPVVTFVGNNPYVKNLMEIQVDVVEASGLHTSTPVEISLDDEATWLPLVKESETRWSYSGDITHLPEGSLPVTIRAMDIHSKIGTAKTTFFKDSMAPLVNFTSFTDAASKTGINGTFTLTGTATDNSAVNEVSIALSSDGGTTWTEWQTAEGGTIWQITVNSNIYVPSQGDLLIKTRSLDSAGNASESASLTLSVDQSTDIPVLSFLQLDSSKGAEDPVNQLVPGSKISGTFSDDDGVDKSSLEININNSGWTPVTAVYGSGKSVTFDHDLPVLTEGIHGVEVRGSDINTPAIAAVPLSAGFSYNSSAPVISFVSGETLIAGKYKKDSFTLVGTAEDGNGLASLSINGVSQTITTPLSQNWSYGYIASSDGAASVLISATDTFGRTTEKSLSFILDTTGPVLNFDNPVTDGVYNGTDLLLKGSAEENNPLKSVALFWKKAGDPAALWTSVPLAPDSSLLNWRALLDTTAVHSDLSSSLRITLRVEAEDEAGNLSVKDMDISVDQREDIPRVEYSNIDASVLNAVDADKNLLNMNGKILGTVFDDDRVNASTIKIKIGNGAWERVSSLKSVVDFTSLNSSSVSWAHELPSDITDGAYYFAVQAQDIYGIPYESAPVHFFVDKAAPEVVINPLADGNYLTSSVSVSGTVIEGNEVQFVQISFDGGTTYNNVSVVNTAVDPVTWSHTGLLPSGINEGSLVIKVKATDQFGKVRATDLPVTIDLTPPAIFFNSYTPESGLPAEVNGEITLDGRVDETSPLASVEYSVNGVDFTAADGKINWRALIDTTAFPDGSIQTITLRAKDAAGNAHIETLDLKIHQEGDKPAISVNNTVPFTSVNAVTVNNIQKETVLAGLFRDAEGINPATLSVNVQKSGAPLPLTLPVRVISSGDSGRELSWFVDLTGQPDGVYSVTASVEDVTANPAEMSVFGIVGREIQTLSSDSVISGLAQDDDQFLASTLKVSVNGRTPVAVSTASADSQKVNWSHDLSGEAGGLIFLELSGTDVYNTPVNWAAYGGENYKVLYIKDSQMPEIVVESPAQGEILKKTVRTKGYADDDSAVRDLAIVAKKLDGSVVINFTEEIFTTDSSAYGYSSTDTRWNWDFSLENLPDSYNQGPVTLSWEATDISGRVVTEERGVTVDDIPPVIGFITHSNNDVVNGTVAVIKGTSSDNTQIHEVKYSLANGVWHDITGYSWQIENLNTTDKSLFIKFTVASVVERDALADAVTGDYSYVTADDAYFKFNGLSWDPAGEIWDVPLYIQAVDKAGNSVTETLNLTLNQSRDYPVFELLNIDVAHNTPASAGSNLLTSGAKLFGLVTDDDGVDVTTIEVKIDNGVVPPVWEPVSGQPASNSVQVSWSHDLKDIGEGVFSVEVRARDIYGVESAPAGNSFGVENPKAYFLVDVTPPMITETEQLLEKSASQTLFKLGGTAADSNALKFISVTEYKDGVLTGYVKDSSGLEMNEVPLSGKSDTWMTGDLPQAGLSDGVYTYKIEVTDVSAISTILEREVVIDRQAPTAPVVNVPSAGSWSQGSSLISAGTGLDNGAAGLSALYWISLPKGTAAPDQITERASWARVDSGDLMNWSIPLNLSAEGEYIFHIFAEDRSGNISTVTAREYNVDQALPEISLESTTELNVNTSFTVKGTALDSNKVAGVSYREKLGAGSFGSPQAASFNSSTGQWSFTRTVLADPADTDGSYEYEITVTDAAGKTRSVNKIVHLDRELPVITLKSPEPHIVEGPTVFANGTVTLSGSASDNRSLSTMEIRVGTGAWTLLADGPHTFTYSVDTTDPLISSDETELIVSLRSTDVAGNQSVESYTLFVSQATDKPDVVISSPLSTTEVNSQTISVSGTVNDDDGVNPASIEIRFNNNDGGGWSAWESVANSTRSSDTSYGYTHTFTSTIDGTKSIEVRAQDINGIHSDSVSVSFKQDTGAPAIHFTSPDLSRLFAGNFSVAGSVEDESEVKDVEYRVLHNGAEVKPWTNMPLTSVIGTKKYSFSTSIDTAAGTGRYEVVLRSRDMGLNTREESRQVTVDKTNPSVSFEEPLNGAKNNNVIVLSGKSSDNEGVEKVSLYVVKGGTERLVADNAGSLNWAFGEFNTGDWANSTNAVSLGGSLWEVTLRARAVDLAGNTGETDYVIQVNQEWDIPVISFGNIDGTTSLDAPVVNGTVLDDDGVSTISVSEDNGATWTLLTPPAGGWTNPAIWSYSVTAADGERTLKVKAEDSSSPSIGGESAAVSFILDRETPDVSILSPADKSNAGLQAQYTVSGSVADENGIKEVLVKVGDNNFNTGAFTAVVNNGTWTVDIPEASVPEGLQDIYVKAVDNSVFNRISETYVSVHVDKTAPVIQVLSPTAGTNVNGQVLVTGTTDDGTGTGIHSVEMYVGRLNSYKAIEGKNIWTAEFGNIDNFAGGDNGYDINDTNKNGVRDGLEEEFKGIWHLDVTIIATDKAGNVATDTSFYLELDPERDRPTVVILDPKEDVMTVGGFKRISGYAHDDDSLEVIQIAFDMNNNGSYTDPEDIWDGHIADASDSKATAWYNAEGTYNWNIVINENGEFNPAGGDSTRTVKFKMRARDVKIHTTGPSVYSPEVEKTLTFDRNYPIFEDITLSTGDTIGGQRVLSGFVKDETDITELYLSYKSPDPQDIELLSTHSVLLTSSDEFYSPGYKKYRFSIVVDTKAGSFSNGSGTMNLSLRAMDDGNNPNAVPISLKVDNISPSVEYAPLSSGLNIVGDKAELTGSAKDSGTVSGVEKVIVYLTYGGNIFQVKGGSSSKSFTESEVLDLENADFDNFRIRIDNNLEEGQDLTAAGDKDGFNEWFTYSAGSYNWSAQFDSTLIRDGSVNVNFVAVDFAGNSAAGSVANALVANNSPVVRSVTVGTDIDGNSLAEAGEKESVTVFTTASALTIKNKYLYFRPEVTRGNRENPMTATLRFGGNVLVSAPLQDIPADPESAQYAELILDSSSPHWASINDTNGTPGEFEITITDNTSTATLTDVKSVYLEVDNADTTKPVTRIEHLSASDKTEGHVETWKNSPFNNRDEGFNKAVEHMDNDADVSGNVILRGSAWDDQRVGSLTLWIDKNGDGLTTGELITVAETSPVTGLLESKDSSFVIESPQSLSVEGGHRVNWTYTWDTSTVTGMAAADIQLKMTAADVTGNVSDTATVPGSEYDSENPGKEFNHFQVDVVPYISEIRTQLSTKSNAVPSVINRGATGRYPVRVAKERTRSEIITIKGYNLTAHRVMISSDQDGLNNDGTIAAGFNLNQITEVVSGKELSVQLYQTGVFSSVVDLDRSGYLNFIAQNGALNIPALNNINSNEIAENQEPNNRNNNLLTDDRFIEAWLFNQFDPGEDIRMADMSVKPGVGGGSETLSFSLGYSSDRQAILENVENTVNVLRTRKSYTRYFDNRMTYNSDGGYFTVAQCGDTYQSPTGEDFHQGSSFGIVHNAVSGIGSKDEYNSNHFIRIESNWNGAGFNNLERVQNPDIQVSGNNSRSKVYLSYYDSTDNMVKFRFFEMGTGLTDGYDIGTTGVKSTLYPYGPDGTIQANKTVQAQLNHAASRKQGYIVIAGGDNTSPYNAVAYSGNTAIVAWFDGGSNTLKLSSNTDPANSYSGYQEYQTNFSVGNYSVNLVVDGVTYENITFSAGSSVWELAYHMNKAFLPYGAMAEINAGNGTELINGNKRPLIIRSFTTGPGSSVSITAPTSAPGGSTSAVSSLLTSPITGNGDGQPWNEIIVDDATAGKHVAMEVDALGGVHLAYEDTSAGDLKYTYLKNLAAAPVTVTVDSYMQTGQFVDLAVMEEVIGQSGGTPVKAWVPYISYYSLSYADSWSAAKIARPVVDINASVTGLEDVIDHGVNRSTELFTGKWHVNSLPALGNVDQYRVNIDVKRSTSEIFLGFKSDRVLEYTRYLKEK